MFWPAANSFSLSLTRWDGIGAAEPVGLQNYGELAADPIFRTALRNNVIWVLGFGGLSVVGGLGLALALNKPRRRWSASTAARSSCRWSFSLAVTACSGASSTSPTGRQRRPRPARARVPANGSGSPTPTRPLRRAHRRRVAADRLHHGALPGRPQGRRPGARRGRRVDGANAWQRFWHIIMPQLRGVNAVVFAVTVIDSLRTFDIVWAMTRGGPYNSSELLSTYMFQQAFTHGASATPRRSPWSSSARDRLHHRLPRPRQAGRRTDWQHSPHPSPRRPRRRPAPRPRAARSPWLPRRDDPGVAAVARPIVFVLFVAIRTFDDIAADGLGACPTSFTLDSFATRSPTAACCRPLVNSVWSPSPRSSLTLALASVAAFALSRFAHPRPPHHPAAMLAGNLLPPQILLDPGRAHHRGHRHLRHPARARSSCRSASASASTPSCCTASCAACPTRSSRPHGSTAPAPAASSGRSAAAVRPALAALGGAGVHLDLQRPALGDHGAAHRVEVPVTAGLLNLQGGYVSQWNVVAAGSLIAAVPTAIVFFMFQKQFVSGLLVGANK